MSRVIHLETAGKERTLLTREIVLAIRELMRQAEPDFRMDWEWTARLGRSMRKALLDEDWSTVAMNASQVAIKLQKVKVPQRNRLGAPWEGAWERLQAQID